MVESCVNVLFQVGEAIVLDGIVSSPLRMPHALKKQWEDLGSQIKNFDCSEFPTVISKYYYIRLFWKLWVSPCT